jgi:predicted DNA-binding protein
MKAILRDNQLGARLANTKAYTCRERIKVDINSVLIEALH